MISRQVFTRAPLRLKSQTPLAPFRSTLQRRLASNDGQPPLTGAADNAFNRERRAVKNHAAATAGMSPDVVTSKST